jgi:amyloid beta precursor protein binding protein 1
MINMNIEKDQPSDKTAKYDRQLRLWGNHGQSNLERSRICLINATAIGKGK